MQKERHFFKCISVCRFNSSTTSATRLIVSAGFFSLSVVIIFLHILVYIILWLCWEYLFLLGIYLLIVFYLVASAVSFPVTISLFMGFLFIYFAFLILNPILHRNSLMLHKGYLLFSILSRLIYLLSKTLSSSQILPSSSTPFRQYLLQSYIKHDTPLVIQFDTSIINPLYSIPEPQLVSSNNF